MSFNSLEKTTTNHPSSSSRDSSETIGRDSRGLFGTVLPSAIEKQFASIEHSVYELGSALHELRRLCPHIQSTPRIRSLADKIESFRTEIREDSRSMRTRLCVPFTIVETRLEGECNEVMQPGIIEARSKDGPMFMRGEAAPADRGHMLQLDDWAPFSLDVKYSSEGDYQNWRLPYKLVFTPDSGWLDATGNPFPSLSVAVDDSGIVECAWRRGVWDEKKRMVTHLEEELLQCKNNPTLAPDVKWRLKPMTLKAGRIIKEPGTQISGASSTSDISAACMSSARSKESTTSHGRGSTLAEGSSDAARGSSTMYATQNKRGRSQEEDEPVEALNRSKRRKT